MRVLLALGGNAMTAADGRARAGGPDRRGAGGDGRRRRPAASRTVDVVLTHGNGPQVGNLLVKNELAAAVVPPVPLDWCGAQTQATLGFVLMNALDAALAERGGRPAYGDAWSPARSSTPTTPASPTRPSRSAATCRPRTPRCSSSTARPGRTAARRAGAGSSPRPSRWRSSTRPAVHALVDAGLRRRRERWRRHPRRPRGRRVAARRRGGHRQGPRRRAAGAHRRAPTCS